MTDAQHLKWADALRKIKDPTRKAYHLLGLLTGQRPGELARLKLSDVLPEERCLVIRRAKAYNDIQSPLSRPIEQALKLARDAHNGKSEWLNSRPPLRVAALRRNSREIVDAGRPSRRATSRIE